MRRNRARIGFLVVLTIGAAIALAADREPAPRFSAKSMDGQKFNNESIKGKVTLIQFWTTWCQYCRGEQPVLDAITRKYADKSLIVLAVDFGEPKGRVKKYLQENPRAPHIVLMEDTNLAAMFPTRSFPVYVAIDREGNVAGIQRGAGGEDALLRLLARAGLEIE